MSKFGNIILNNEHYPELVAMANVGSSGMQLNTGSGYLQFGPLNTSHCHFQTDRSNFYFNTELRVNGGIIGSYDENLILRRASNSGHQIEMSTTTITNSLRTNMPQLQVKNGSSASLAHIGRATATGYATNDGSWGARLQVSDTVHAKIEVSQEANSMRSLWYAHTGQDSIKFGTSTDHDVEFQRNGSTSLEIEDGGIMANVPIRRNSHHASGFLEGSYNNVGTGGNGTKSNPIYTIGSSYNPTESALSNMYGIGFCSSASSFVTFTGASNWGMYVAADGDARVFLDGSSGNICAGGQVFADAGSGGVATRIGEDGTYESYGVLGFGGDTNGYNRVFGDNGTSDGLFLCSATGRKVFVRSNGLGTDSLALGEDDSYGGYSAIGFGSLVSNGYNRVFGSKTQSDGLFLCSATGRDIYFRSNGSGSNTFSMTSAGILQQAGDTVIAANGDIEIRSQSQSKSKIQLWGDSTQYAIGMTNGVTYGGINNDYCMTFMFNDDNDRGFWWGDENHSNSQGAMALTTNGKLTVGHSIRAGYGEGDTTVPGSAYRLDVNGHGQVVGRFYAIDGLLRTNRRIGTSQTSPVGHFTDGEQVFALDTTWTDAELQAYFNSSNVSWNNQSDAPGGYAIYINGGVSVGGVYGSGFPYIPVQEGDEFYMECWIKNAGVSQTHYMGSNEFNSGFSSTGGNPGSYGYWTMSNYNPGTSWTKVTGYLRNTGGSSTIGEFESGSKYMTPLALFNYGAGSGTRACYISGWKVIRVRHQGNRTFAGNVTLGVGGSTGVLRLKTYDDATNEWQMYTWTDDTFRLNYNGSGGDEMIMDSSGNVVFTGNVTAYSDDRLKENIETLDGSKVLQMRGVSFIKDGKAGSGVIAQELEKIAPELIHQVDEYKSVAYGNLVGYLIENAKQQQKQIEKLEELVQRLTSEK